MAGGDKSDFRLVCVDLGEGDREQGPLSVAGVDGGLAGMRREAAWSVSVSFEGPHGDFARSGCGWSLSLLGGPGGVGGRSKENP